LETIYGAFDTIAKQRRVFKVETVGDCYVAVAGVPNARRDHATVMCRFARDCLIKMNQLTNRLEVALGPDTADLAFRVGLHSGPVTGGVLRSDNARFQLFGDTMNTASRMESTSQMNRIQISETTMQLLESAGKTNWYKKRDTTVDVKGKGNLQTYWLNVSSPDGASTTSGSSDNSDRPALGSASKDEDLKQGLKKIRAAEHSSSNDRSSSGNTTAAARRSSSVNAKAAANGFDTKTQVDWTTSLEHMRDLTVKDERLVSWNAAVLKERLGEIIAKRQGTDQKKAQVPDDAARQLEKYIGEIAGKYNDNEFHNFEHASHVTMSVTKLLTRVVTLDDDHYKNKKDKKKSSSSTDSAEDHSESSSSSSSSACQEYTRGISNDPLTKFAVILCALVHDADHPGVPNAQVVKEKHERAEQYGNRSVAESHSISVAWGLLMKDEYVALRRCICPTAEDLDRFHDLIVTVVLATDIVDKDLKAERNARWAKVFSESGDNVDDMDELNQLRATIVIEHLIQASDVCHTMQHWHIYRKWNERFFMECYKAYKQGRAETNPVDNWYKGELGFFDFYIIPLAQKLCDCGLFEASAVELLNYAESNRLEWENKGKEVVESLIEKYCDEEEEHVIQEATAPAAVKKAVAAEA